MSSPLRFPLYSRTKFLSEHDLQTTEGKLKTSLEELSHQMEVDFSGSKITLKPKNDMAVRGATLFRVEFSGRINTENRKTIIKGTFHLPYFTIAIFTSFFGFFLFEILPLILPLALSDFDPVGMAFGGMLFGSKRGRWLVM